MIVSSFCFDEDKSIEAIYAVQDYLSNAIVYEEEQRIAVDRKKHTIEEISRQIAQNYSIRTSLVRTHVIGWLEMGYVPFNYSKEQMEQFESTIEKWVSSLERDKA